MFLSRRYGEALTSRSILKEREEKKTQPAMKILSGVIMRIIKHLVKAFVCNENRKEYNCNTDDNYHRRNTHNYHTLALSVSIYICN